MIGALQPMKYVDNQIILSEGDVVWLYSDGLIEARRGEAMYSVQRLASSIKAVCTSQLEAEVQARCVFEQVQSWQNKDEFDDDASLLQVRWRG